MTPIESVKQMWTDYHLLIGLSAPKEPLADAFCDNEKDANELAVLVNRGIKRATAGALWSYQKANRKLSEVGEIFVVKDWPGRAVCIVKTVKVSIIPFNQITEEHAYIEGEGDRSLAYWRRVHIQFFNNEFRDLDLTFDESMPIVFEEFVRVFPKLAGPSDL